MIEPVDLENGPSVGSTSQPGEQRKKLLQVGDLSQKAMWTPQMWSHAGTATQLIFFSSFFHRGKIPTADRATWPNSPPSLALISARVAKEKLGPVCLRSELMRAERSSRCPPPRFPHISLPGKKRDIPNQAKWDTGKTRTGDFTGDRRRWERL